MEITIVILLVLNLAKLAFTEESPSPTTETTSTVTTNNPQTNSATSEQVGNTTNAITCVSSPQPIPSGRLCVERGCSAEASCTIRGLEKERCCSYLVSDEETTCCLGYVAERNTTTSRFPWDKLTPYVGPNLRITTRYPWNILPSSTQTRANNPRTSNLPNYRSTLTASPSTLSSSIISSSSTSESTTSTPPASTSE